MIVIIYFFFIPYLWIAFLFPTLQCFDYQFHFMFFPVAFSYLNLFIHQPKMQFKRESCTFKNEMILLSSYIFPKKNKL